MTSDSFLSFGRAVANNTKISTFAKEATLDAKHIFGLVVSLPVECSRPENLVESSLTSFIPVIESNDP